MIAFAKLCKDVRSMFSYRVAGILNYRELPCLSEEYLGPRGQLNS